VAVVASSVVAAERARAPTEKVTGAAWMVGTAEAKQVDAPVVGLEVVWVAC